MLPIKRYQHLNNGFSTLFHEARYSVNEFLSLSISNILGLEYYIWKSPPPYTVCYSLFPARGECTHVPSIQKMLVCLHFEKPFRRWSAACGPKIV